MSYKLVALDLDETLLDEEGKLNIETIDVIKQISNLGIRIIVCTGRIFGSARYFAKLMELDEFIVASNGALISNYKLDRILLEKRIDNDICFKIFEVLNELDIYYHFYNHIELCTKQLTYRSKRYNEWNSLLKKEDQIIINVLKNPIEFLKNSDMHIYKIVVFDKDCTKIQTLIQKLKLFDIEIYSSSENSFDITKGGSSKGNALKLIANYYGIKRDEIIAIGDNENDLSMIKYAGLGVAVDNAQLIVKENANIVIDSNKELGVAMFLKELLL